MGQLVRRKTLCIPYPQAHRADYPARQRFSLSFCSVRDERELVLITARYPLSSHFTCVVLHTKQFFFGELLEFRLFHRLLLIEASKIREVLYATKYTERQRNRRTKLKLASKTKKTTLSSAWRFANWNWNNLKLNNLPINPHIMHASLTINSLFRWCYIQQ